MPSRLGVMLGEVCMEHVYLMLDGHILQEYLGLAAQEVHEVCSVWVQAAPFSR